MTRFTLAVLLLAVLFLAQSARTQNIIDIDYDYADNYVGGSAGEDADYAENNSPRPPNGPIPEYEEDYENGENYADYSNGVPPTINTNETTGGIPRECTELFASAAFVDQSELCRNDYAKNDTICPESCVSLYKSVPEICIQTAIRIIAEGTSPEEFGIDLDPENPCVKDIISGLAPAPAPNPSPTAAPPSPEPVVVPSPSEGPVPAPEPVTPAAVPPAPSSASRASVVLAAAVAVVGLVMMA